MHIQIGETFPDHLRLNLVRMALSHQINRTMNDPECNAFAKNLYHYRGVVMRSPREDINVGHKRTGDIVITGIIALLLADVSRISMKQFELSTRVNHVSCFITGPVRRLVKLAMPHREGSEINHVAWRYSCTGRIKNLETAASFFTYICP